MAARLLIYTQIHSRYRVFDASGHLPFSIVFGFCRRGTTDTDMRAIVLTISGSVLDVPYALANGLLTLHERDPHDTHHYIDVDLSGLRKTPAENAEFLSLPSPVNRIQSWRESFTTYSYPVNVDSKLASILDPGKKYSIRLASQDLGVRWWVYSDHEDHISGCDEKLSQPPEDAKLINSKSKGGNATFRVVRSLPWPPRIETRMRFASPGHPTDSHRLGISVTNAGELSVTFQTRNEQRFLIPWGPMQPLYDHLSDSLPHIVDTSSHIPPTSTQQLGKWLEKTIPSVVGCAC